MKHMMLLTLLMALIAIPMRFANVKRPDRALRRMTVWIFVFAAFYMVALRFVYPRLL